MAQAERALRELELHGGRVRHHGPIARVELPPEPMARLFASDTLRSTLIARVRQAGFRYVCLDLEGYRRAGLEAAAPSAPRSAPADAISMERNP